MFHVFYNCNFVDSLHDPLWTHPISESVLVKYQILSNSFLSARITDEGSVPNNR